jgi:hypothetical protein
MNTDPLDGRQVLGAISKAGRTKFPIPPDTLVVKYEEITTPKSRVIAQVVSMLNSKDFINQVLADEPSMEHKAEALKELAAVIDAIKGNV